MAKLHHKGSSDFDPEFALRRLQQFLTSCRQPFLWEEGDEPLDLAAHPYSLEVQSGRLWLEAGDDRRQFSRRILSIEAARPGSMLCTVHRFGNVPGKLTFYDRDRPASATVITAAARKSFGEKFRLMLSRTLPGAEILSLSSARDLQRSLSSLYPRAHVLQGRRHMAALACSSVEDESGFLTAALLWHSLLRSRLDSAQSLSLVLFLPEGSGALTAQRLRWLTAIDLHPAIFLYNEHGSAGSVELDDLGNVDTRILQSGEARSIPEQVSGPELLLESAIRRHLSVVDPMLDPAHVHSQILTFLSGERSILDLLAVERTGRLVILELKASEDLQLPLQALDYWIRIRFHAARGELDPLFPGVSLVSDLPRLLLVAPATRFHSANETVLEYFSPEISVERIGLNSAAARRLTVVVRLGGADPPISHRND